MSESQSPLEATSSEAQITLSEPVPLTPSQQKTVTLGVMLGLFLGALESTVVGTAMPTVIASLGGLHIYSWVFSAYILTSTRHRPPVGAAL
jgi:hypothetical protein